MKSEDFQTEKDSFLCTCGPCKRFWRHSYSDGNASLHCEARSRAIGTSSLAVKEGGILKYGDRVLVKRKHPGSVRYVGFLDDQVIAPRLYVGVKLDDNIHSLHNGLYQGKRYFNCPKGHGAMVTVNNIYPLKTANPRPPVTGNNMYPSFEEVQQRRREREKKLAKMYKEAEKPREFEIANPPKSPRISPRPNKTTKLRMGSAPTQINIGDPHDIAYRDEQRKERKKLAMLEETLMSPEERQLQRWRRGFGGSAEGERLANTLQKLQHAYQEGLSLTHRTSSFNSN